MKTCDRCKLGCLKRYAVDFVQTQFKHKKHFVCWRCLNWLEIQFAKKRGRG